MARADEGKYARRLETEKRLLGELIEMLPPFDVFRQCFSPTLTNWLPFYWAGFQATVRYTYRIEDLSDLDGSAASSRSTSGAGSARRSARSRSTTTARSRSCSGSTCRPTRARA